MLDKRKIRLMTRMSTYEKYEARQDLKISSYYRKDYTSLNTLISIFWVTVGYAVIAVLFVLCNMDAMLADLTIMKLISIVAAALGIYLVLLVIYGVCAASYYKAKHTKAKRRVKKYYRDLSRLEKMEMKEKK